MSISLSTLQAPNKALNCTISQAHGVVESLLNNGFSNPRLYANQTVSGPNVAFMIPEKSGQDKFNDQFADYSTNLNEQKIPDNIALFLQVKVDGKEDYFCVASIIFQVVFYGTPLKDTLK